MKNLLEMGQQTEYGNKRPTARIVRNSILKCNIPTRSILVFLPILIVKTIKKVENCKVCYLQHHFLPP